jgi:hypothetical protein
VSARVDGRTLGPKRDGLHDGQNHLNKDGLKARERALRTIRATFVRSEPWRERVSLAALARQHGVPYGAVSYACWERGWKIEKRANEGRRWLQTFAPGTTSAEEYAQRELRDPHNWIAPGSEDEFLDRYRRLWEQSQRGVREWEEFRRASGSERVRLASLYGRCPSKSPRSAPAPLADDPAQLAPVLAFQPQSAPRQDLGTPAAVFDLASWRKKLQADRLGQLA